ncbi:bifunctional folylpolyglutamate synthase/dihydrofolate synthase [Blautia sp. OF03-15BH]|uniref:bifunctional folylpolyglutamate synthase/dihydrofolate synthase n=1 Tax=Blautia sp. OF03-15BH TaxID=2292287 RepID=UPI000E4AB1B1|nr:folylpolyglutamate synthase/dihydrofolate synthase family protein [Blautia sp. OF03-15BH]RGY01870.1 bifunctional folylpolyglutamate synthase/dihydrofolate synthase [Blautia sp. OF03-15BH]
MNYEEARVYLDNVAKYGSVLGLDAMRELLRRLGNPEKGLKIVHIAGTNGKGSVLAFLSTVLTESGYRVGRYISPTLFSYRERIQVDGEYIEKEPLARLVTRIREASEAMDRDGLRTPTAFEIETALGLLYFAEKKCDIVVLETGMGGRDDATNAIAEVMMEIFASISLDHLGVLGNDLTEIAECKADIIRKNSLVISAFQKEEAAEVLKRTAAERNAKLITVDPGQISDVKYGYEEQSFSYGAEKNIRIHLAGAYQIENAALAWEAVQGLRSLGFRISDEAFRRGMEKTVWRGRFTCIHREPLVIMDGAHNEDAAKKLAASIETYFPGRKISYIMGVFKDKEYEKVIRITAPYAAKVTAVETPGNPRALPKEELKKVWETFGVPVTTADTIAEAVKENITSAEKEEIILVFGSLSFLGEAEKAVKELG